MERSYPWNASIPPDVRISQACPNAPEFPGKILEIIRDPEKVFFYRAGPDEQARQIVGAPSLTLYFDSVPDI